MKNKTFTNIIFIIVSALLVLLVKDRVEAMSSSYQGVLMESRTYVYVSALLFVTLLISLFYHPKIKLDGVSKSFLMFIVYSYFILGLHSLSYGVSSLVFITFLLPALSFFYFLFLPYNVSGSLTKIVIPIIFVTIAYICFSNLRTISILVSTEIASNISYYVLAFSPFMLLGKNQLLKGLTILVVLASIIFSFKRGGLVAFLLGMLLYFYALWRSKENRKNSFILHFSTIIAILLIVFVYFQLDDFTANVLGNKMLSIGDDGGSTRNEIYKEVLSALTKSDFVQLLFGHGWDSVSRTGAGVSAHNDYLQLAYDLGIISLSLYLTFFIRLVRKCILLIRNHSSSAPAFACSLGIFFVLSMVSHVYLYSQFFILFTSFWGFIESNIYKNENRTIGVSLRK